MKNEQFINAELNWITNVIVTRLKLYFKENTETNDINYIVPPSIEKGQGAYSEFILRNGLKFEDRIYLALAIIPQLKPQLLDCFNVKNSNTDQRFVEFGCIEKENGRGILPTLDTVLFLLAGDNVEIRIQYLRYFTQHKLFKGSLFLNTEAIVPSLELMETIVYERSFMPDFSTTFPAHRITTNRSWEDLILDKNTMTQINDIKLWVSNGEKLLNEWNLNGKIKRGYRTLFYGLPGTGKTFTASLLGKSTGKEVYCVDLSMVISKYIGETEKNLSHVFEVAEGKDLILFFDEADALFGKRTNIKDSHDRYANQEVAYLLQRIEDYPGLVILSTNQKNNIDEAFARRFQSIIRFSMPSAEERERLWKETFSEKCTFEDKLSINEIAQKYEMAGGSILNVVHYSSLMAFSRNETCIKKEDVIEGIRREFRKEGKVFDCT